MKISRLQLVNFRNLEEQILQFSPGINCIFGDNGNGKTNVLEAIHFLSAKKSFRKNTRFPQLLSIDSEKPFFYINGLFENESHHSSVNLAIRVDQNGNEFYEGGQRAKSHTGFPVVFINPFDSWGFFQKSSNRRTWVDTHLSLLDSEYKKVLNKYNTVLRNRNSLLSKKPSQFIEQIKALDLQFVEYTHFLTGKRLQFLDELSSDIGNTFHQIFSEEHEIKLELETKIKVDSKEDTRYLLAENFEKDKIMGVTNYGIHKDDYLLLFDQFFATEFCSLGQQKTSYLSLVFAYISLFRYKFNSFPIVLIDDVSGELDQLRWRNLVEYLEGCSFQVLITTANEKFKEELLKIDSAQKLKVEAGLVSTI